MAGDKQFVLFREVVLFKSVFYQRSTVYTSYDNKAYTAIISGIKCPPVHGS